MISGGGTMMKSKDTSKVSGEDKVQESEFASYLKDLRKQRGLNQQQLAQMVEITSGYYGFFEQGRAIPSAKIIRRLARALKANLREMMQAAGYDPEAADAKDDSRYQDVPRDAGEGEAEAQDKNDLYESTVDEQQKTEDEPAHRDDAGERGISAKRLKWALMCISNDPEYQLGEQYKNVSLPEALLIRLYQAETRRQLLTPEESAALV